MPTDAWVHVELSRDRGIWRCFINGTETGDDQVSTGSLGAEARQLKFGYSGVLNDKFTGYMDEFRVSTIVRHTANFTPPTEPYKDDIHTHLLMHMDGGGGIDPETLLPTVAGQGTYLPDASTKGLFYNDDGVLTNKSVIDFDGTGDYLILKPAHEAMPTPSIPDFNFGTGPFTLEGWVFLDTTAAGGTGEAATFCGAPELITADGWRAAVWSVSGIYGFTFAVNDGSSGWPIHPEPATTFPLHRWKHWAVTRSGNEWTIWIDGLAVGFDTSSYDFDMGLAGFQVGRTNNSGQRYIDGRQDQIRLSDTARYDAVYTEPSAAFSSDSDTSLLLHLDGSNDGTTFTDSSSGAHTVSRTGNIVTKTGEKKFGTASGYWNGGSANYLSVADHADFQFGTGAFTIEAWVYPVSAGGSVENMILAKGTGSDYWMLRHEENNTQGRVRWFAAQDSTTVVDIKVNMYAAEWAYDTWHHIAVTSDGNTHVLLVDGRAIGSDTPSIANWDFFRISSSGWK